jgi:hypothetical protein
MNFWIFEKVNEKTCAVYQKMLLESNIKGKETPLHFAGREGNENIFCFLYSALATKTEYFKSRKSKIENFLLEVPKRDRDSKIYPYTAFVEYFKTCNDNFNILSKVQNYFGEDFFMKVLSIEMYENQKFLHAICQRDSENILKIFNFLRKFSSNDLKFFEEFLLSKDENCRSFLHHAFEYLKNETLTAIFEELSSWKALLGQDFVNELILMKSENFYAYIYNPHSFNNFGVFLSSYAYKSDHFSNDHFFSFLNQIKLLCDQETLRKFFLAVGNESRTFLHFFCYLARAFDLQQLLEWVARELGNEVLTELILLRDSENRTIFHYFTASRSKQSNSGLKLLSILRFLKNDLKFENEFLIDKILFTDDEDGDSVPNLFEKNQGKKFYLIFLDFWKNELNLSDKSLKKYLVQSKFFFSIAQIKEKENRDEILNFFTAKFDETFFSCFFSSEVFHKICLKYSEYDTDKIVKYLNFVAEKNGFVFLKIYVSGKNSKKQTILFYFHHYSYFSWSLFDILKWFEKTFKNDVNFFQNFLLQVDENSDSFLNFVLKKYDGLMTDFFTETFNFLLRNFDKVFIKEFLLLKNKKSKNFLNIICEKLADDWYQKITQTLDILFKDFQNDQDFFTKLINEKSKKNRQIKDFMKDKFDIDLSEEEEESEILEFFNIQEF